MSSTSIKVGLLGAGYILQAHAKALRELPHVSIHAICDLSRSRAKQATDQYGAQHVFTSIEDLARSDCDAVHVLLPPGLHAAAAAKLLQSGKHVFLEKPMAIGLAECRQLVNISRAKRVRLGVNHNFLFVPAYEELRERVHDGRLGRVDHVTVNWLFGLGLLQAGPYNNWMLKSPENLLFELGPHLAGFVLDLMGPPEVLQAIASHPIDLPGRQRVYRHWNAVGSAGGSSFALNLSLSPGQPDRSVHVRGHAASGSVDFARNMGVTYKSTSNNPIFDDFAVGRAAAAQVRARAWSNIRGYARETLRKSALSNPFEQSIARSVAAFHAPGDTPLDRRVDGAFGVQVIELLERIAQQSGATSAASPQVTSAPAVAAAAVSSASKGRALVVGGTGFIGKRLVRALRAAGWQVRVLSRSRASAEVELEDPSVQIVEGGHGDARALDEALPGVDVVFHLAKALGKRWDDYVRNDIEPTKVLAEAAVKHGVKRFIYTGTIDSYHSSDPSVVIDGTTAVDSQIESRNLYARSKAACEKLLSGMQREGKLPLVIFRPGIVIGEGSPPAHWGVGMFNSDTRVDYWGDGDNKIPLVLVDDVADALVRGASTADIEGQSFLLTSPPVMTARDYVSEVTRLSGSRVEAQPRSILRYFFSDMVKEFLKHLIHHPNRRVPSLRDWACRAHRSRYDSSRTVEVLGWAPASSREAMIERGIRPSVQHYMR